MTKIEDLPSWTASEAEKVRNTLICPKCRDIAKRRMVFQKTEQCKCGDHEYEKEGYGFFPDCQCNCGLSTLAITESTGSA